MPTNLLFRQILEASDGIHELIKIGCINICKPLLRTALDCYLQFAFISEKDEKNRAKHFLYHYNRNKLDQLEKILFPEKENSLAKKLKNDSVMNEVSLTIEERKMAEADYTTLKEILNSDENEKVANEYGKKKRQKWYQVFINSTTIEELAKCLNRSAMYEIPFRNLSSFIHGEDIIHSNVIFYPGEKVGVRQLRDISQLNYIVSNMVIIIRRAILLFIESKMDKDIVLLMKLKSISDKEKESRKKNNG